MLTMNGIFKDFLKKEDSELTKTNRSMHHTNKKKSNKDKKKLHGSSQSFSHWPPLLYIFQLW
jgi:hypothetical protein